jgi:hypothetical protein
MSTHAMTTTAFLLGLPLIQHRSIVTAPLSPRQRWVYACASSSTTTSISTASNDKSIAPRLRVVKVPRVFEHADTAVDTMLRPSPLHREAHHFVDGGLVLAQTVVRAVDAVEAADADGSIECVPWDTEAYLRAGPRRKVFFGEDARVAVVTCGGLAPGLNTILRELVMCLNKDYGGTLNVRHTGCRVPLMLARY